MATLIGYFFLGAGIVIFLVSLLDDPRKSKPLKFAAIMLVVGGLVALQFAGTAVPAS